MHYLFPHVKKNHFSPDFVESCVVVNVDLTNRPPFFVMQLKTDPSKIFKRIRLVHAIVKDKSLSEISFSIFFSHFFSVFFSYIMRYRSDSNGDIDSMRGQLHDLL